MDNNLEKTLKLKIERTLLSLTILLVIKHKRHAAR